jgi:peptide/nickel transport system substrate-binding protein
VLRPSTDLADFGNRIGQWNYQLAMNATFNYPDPLIGVHRSFVCSNIRKVLWANTEGYCNEKLGACC